MSDMIIASLMLATNFDEFKAAVTADFVRQENEAKDDADKARVDAETKAEILADFNPADISPEMVRDLKITNGMPEWLILQRYSEWVSSHG